MNTVIIVLIFMFSYTAGAFSSLGGIKKELDNIKKKYECLEEEISEQKEYSNCLKRCIRDQELDRSLGSTYISSCTCSQPISIGCY